MTEELTGTHRLIEIRAVTRFCQSPIFYILLIIIVILLFFTAYSSLSVPLIALTD